MLHWEFESKFKMVPAFACKMRSKFLLLHLFAFSSSVFSYTNNNYKCRECWGFLPFRQEKDSGSAFLSPKQRFVSLWWFCGVQPWYLGSSCPKAAAQWSYALPHSGRDVLESSFYFTLGRESSAFLCQWRITLQHLMLLHSGAVVFSSFCCCRGI